MTVNHREVLRIAAVGDVHVNKTGAGTLQPLFAVGGGLDGVALACQQIAQRAQDVRLVIDDEDWPR